MTLSFTRYGSLRENRVGSLVISRTRSQLFDPTDSQRNDYPCLFTESEGDVEEYIPYRSLYGLIPDALLECFQFWKTGSRTLRGYPRSDTSIGTSWWDDSMILVRLFDSENGSLSAFIVRVQLTLSPSGSECKRAGIAHPMLLHNPLSTSSDCCLEQICVLMSQLDSCSHLLFWASVPTGIPSLFGVHLPVTNIELPRIKARFAVDYKVDPSDVTSPISIRSLDQDGWTVFSEGDSDPLIRAYTSVLPHYLVLKNRYAETAIMLPNYGLSRPEILAAPLSTTMRTDRSSKWSDNVRTRFYLYPLHISGAFLRTTSIASALYMTVVRIYKREYIAAALLLQACETDSHLTREEKWILSLVSGTMKDHHPNAHALRLRLALICYECGCVPIPWNSTNKLPEPVDQDYEDYLKKYSHVSSVCRLSTEDEMRFIEHRNRDIGEESPLRARRLRYSELLTESNLSAEKANQMESSGDIEGAANLRKELFGPMEVRMRPPDQTGRRAIFFIQKLLPSAMNALTQRGSLFSVLTRYTRPTADITLSSDAFDILEKFFDDDLMGYGKQTGFLLLYEMLTGVVQFKLASFTRPLPTASSESKEGENDGKDTALDPTMTLAKLIGRSLFLGFFKKLVEEQNGSPISEMETMLFSILFILTTAAENGQASLFPVFPYLECQPALSSDGLNFGSPQLRPFTSQLIAVVTKIYESEQWSNQPVLQSKREFSGIITNLYISSKNRTISYPVYSNFSEPSLPLRSLPLSFPHHHSSLSLSDDDIANFTNSPLSSLNILSHVCFSPVLVPPEYSEKLPFELSSHPCGSTPCGKSRLRHLQNDMKDSYNKMLTEIQAELVYLTNEHIQTFYGTEQEKAVAILTEAEAKLSDLLRDLCGFQQEESRTLRLSVRQVESLANVVADPDKDTHGFDLSVEQLQFILMRRAGLKVKFWFENLCGSMMSSNAAIDLRTYNPFLTTERVDELRNCIGGVLSRSVRLNQVNRCISSVSSLKSDVAALIHAIKTEGILSIPKAKIEMLRHSAANLALQLSSKRHFGSLHENTIHYDPRYLVFEYSSGYLLRRKQIDLMNTFLESYERGESLVHQMIMGAGKTTVIGPLLSLLLADGKSLVTMVVPAALLEQSRAIFRGVFSHVISKRVYTISFERSGHGSDQPAFLDALYQKLRRARRERAIICTTPESVKSLFLKYLDLLQSVNSCTPLLSLPRSLVPPAAVRQLNLEAMGKHFRNYSLAADSLSKILRLWSGEDNQKEGGKGIVLVDEVDLVLHPLRSETNFPIGQKEPLDLSPKRWEVAFHILDSLFFRSTGRVTTSDFHPEKGSLESLDKISSSMESGEMKSFIQRLPHPILLQKDFYVEEMRHFIARWGIVWLEKQKEYTQGKEAMGERGVKVFSNGTADFEIHGPFAHPSGVIEDYLTQLVIPHSLQQIINSYFSPLAIQFLNLVRDWVVSFLPYCLTKINRVSYGILQDADLSRWESSVVDKMMPSRLKLAVPFIGKDVPSEASEFAHPEVLIGLTILAYRYEGLHLH
jgi:hypothetical protein